MHPIQLLLALKAYSLGRPLTGQGDSWRPSQKIVEALDEAFYLAFENIIPANVPTVLALDVSGSMSSCAAGTLLSAREASTAMALATVRTEPQTTVMAFSDKFVELPFNRKTSLHEACKYTARLPFSSTDCSLPFIWARKNRIRGIGNFAVYTDAETYAGSSHPNVELQAYRNFAGTDARSVVCATASTGFTIADPQDPGMLDVAGFGADTPQIISAFARGEV
jgi:60 kDa SS-A/Ro ribonucleoprotein